MELRRPLVDIAHAHRKKGRRVALLVRHAERDEIKDLLRHEEALLTINGHAAAEAGGKLLSSYVDDDGDCVFLHSPVERCRQTAHGLHKGLSSAGRKTRIHGVHPSFGATWYLRDAEGIGRAFAEHGRGFVRAWFDGKLGACIDSRDDVAKAQVQALHEQLSQHAFSVSVSHDWNIAAVKEHALGLRFEDHGWPKFLDGVVAYLDGDKVDFDVG